MSNDRPYIVVSGSYIAELEDFAKEWMSRGYEPVGGLSILHRTWENERKGYSESDTNFFQAFARVPAVNREKSGE